MAEMHRARFGEEAGSFMPFPMHHSPKPSSNLGALQTPYFSRDFYEGLLHKHDWLIISHWWSTQPAASLPSLEVRGGGGGLRVPKLLITWLVPWLPVLILRDFSKITSLTRTQIWLKEASYE